MMLRVGHGWCPICVVFCGVLLDSLQFVFFSFPVRFYSPPFVTAVFPLLLCALADSRFNIFTAGWPVFAIFSSVFVLDASIKLALFEIAYLEEIDFEVGIWLVGRVYCLACVCLA